MPDSKSKPLPHDSADAAAEEWFIRRDRGMSEAEQSAYSRWLQEDPRHAAALARVEKLWRVLDPAIASLPADADLPAPSRRHYGWWAIPLAVAAAAAVLLLLPRAPEVVPPPVRAQAILYPGPERLSLPDGSMVDLDAGAKVEVQFTPEVRNVRLVRGTAFFTVAKNPAQPFVVSTGEVSVRAVGTAFSVALDPQDVSVLVTEGRVRVQEMPAPTAPPSVEARELSALDAGQQGVVRRAAPQAPERWAISVTRLTPAEIERALAWQGPRLEFADLPLAAVVAEFNRFSPRKLVVGDEAAAATRVGGSFRADRPEAFLRGLELGFNISSSPHGNEIILRRNPTR
jgi:transmembrane sensor